MDREALKQIMPHREPMLLVDEVELLEGEAVGRYTVRGDEFFLQGHFPDNPVVPGVILCEMMAQSACLLVNEEGGAFTPYFTGMKEIKLKNKVIPGDTIVFRTQLIKKKSAFYFVSGTGHVNGKLCISGELSFAVVK